MDLTSVLVLLAMGLGLLFVIGGDASHAVAEGFSSVWSRVYLAIRAFYERVGVLSTAPSTPFVFRVLLQAFVRVSLFVWLAVMMVLGLFLVYGKAMRSVIRMVI